MTRSGRGNQGSHRISFSLYNAVSAMGLTITNGLLTIVVTRFILSKFGSDFNGLNSTANQIVNVLLILEGGFTLASNVALFYPLTHNDYTQINSILSATKRKFEKIAAIFLSIGIVISVLYAFLVNSALPDELIATIISMAIIPAAFNLYYAATYRVLLQAQQKEYIVNIFTMITVIAGHLFNIILIQLGCAMWMIRFTTMVFALINSVLLGWYVKRKCKFIKLDVHPNEELIQGTNDVMAQKITGVIYESAPIIFLSISPVGGTILASVYAVYNSVFIMLKSLLHGVIDAPRHGFGQILSEREREDVWPIFYEYEYLSFLSVFVLLVTGGGLILPFVKLYTTGIMDAEYYDPMIAFLMVAISSFEMIHIPSGHLINMAGEFRISRNFQVISCVVLIASMLFGGYYFGVYGMLSAILMVASLLAILEMGYIHCFFFKNKIGWLFKILGPLFLSGAVLTYLESRINVQIVDYIAFIKNGMIFTIINLFIGMLIEFLAGHSQMLGVLKRLINIIRK